MSKQWYGSLNNRLMERGEQPTPIIGMGVTELCWSDRHAYTIIEIHNEKTVVVQQDKAIRTDNNGMSESQSYDYFPDPEGTKKILTLRRDGGWREKGLKKGEGSGWQFGDRDEYYDYSF